MRNKTLPIILIVALCCLILSIMLPRARAATHQTGGIVRITGADGTTTIGNGVVTLNNTVVTTKDVITAAGGAEKTIVYLNGQDNNTSRFTGMSQMDIDGSGLVTLYVNKNASGKTIGDAAKDQLTPLTPGSRVSTGNSLTLIGFPKDSTPSLKEVKTTVQSKTKNTLTFNPTGDEFPPGTPLFDGQGMVNALTKGDNTAVIIKRTDYVKIYDATK